MGGTSNIADVAVDAVKTKVEEAKDKVLETGQSWFGNIISAPFSFLWGAVKAPFTFVGDIFKGAWEGTVGNAYNVMMTTAGIFAATYIVPDFVISIPVVGEWLAKRKQEDGNVGLVRDSGLIALALSGGWGAVKGVGNAVMDGTGTKDTSTAEKAGSVTSTLALLAGAGYLAFQHVKSNNMGAANAADGSGSITPDPTPYYTQNKGAETSVPRS